MKYTKHSPSSTGWQWIRLSLVPVIGICLIFPANAQESATRYSHATQLKIRAKPTADSAIVSKLPINQALTLLNQYDKRWCEVELPDTSQHGFVDCSFLHTEPLTLEQIEMEAAKTVLAFNRQTMRIDNNYYRQQIPADTQGVDKSLDAMFTLLERHFAISPSLHTYADYNRLVQLLLNETGGSANENDTGRQALLNLASSRSRQLIAMRDAFSQNFASKSFTPVRHSIGNRLNLLLQQRRFGDINSKASPQGPGVEGALTGPAGKTSFFKGEKWAAGWAGGSLVKRMRARDAEGFVYSVSFDGTGPWALADVYEMAKALRVPVNARFSKMEAEDTSLSQMVNTAGTGPETLILDLDMPVWAVTAQGVVAGRLRRVSFGGDACSSGSKVPTEAEAVFSQPVKGDIHGIFASSTPIDPSRAIVTVRKRAYLEPLGGESTFTNRVDMSVDLDGDGIADLRTVVSNDNDVSSVPANGFMHALAKPHSGYFRRVAGWYANDIYMLQANEDGWWRTLSRYDVVTCT